MNKDTKKLTSIYEEMVLKMVKINDAADEEFDPEELRMGIEDEREHTDDIELAKSIAKDHLQNESPRYYSELKAFKKMNAEKGDVDGAEQPDEIPSYIKA